MNYYPQHHHHHRHCCRCKDSNKVESIQKVRKSVSQLNYCHIFLATVYDLREFQNAIAGDISMFYFLSAFSRTKLTVVLLWILLVSMYTLSKLGTFALLSVSFNDFFHVLQLQTTSADLRLQ
jgi:hypothetical protein